MNDIKLSEKQIKEAIENRWCPHCQLWNFVAVYCLAGRNFCSDSKGHIIWGQWNEGLIMDITNVTCNACGEDIPREIWGKWFEEK